MKLELRVVARYAGWLTLALSALIAVVAGFAAVQRLTGRTSDPADMYALGLAALVGAAMGGLLVVMGKRSEDLLGQQEALLLVACSWLIGAALSAVPYRAWAALRPDAGDASHDFDSVVNCFFESMSGLTTTGATIVQQIGTLPDSLLLWRSLTHWLGGLGIVVLFVAVLPMIGAGSRRLYRIEAPGPSPEGVKPRIQDTARILWFIYLGLTVAEILALRLCGMTWFEATCHTFATLATGGFSTQDASIGAFPSMAVHAVIIVFMILAGINFGLYHQLLRGHWRAVRKDPELRVYLGIILVATAIVTTSLVRGEGQAAPDAVPVAFGEHAEQALFQVVAVQTTTGFCSVDFDAWGFSAKATLLVLMFIGGSAGSTGGGIKVMRIIIGVKILLAELEHMYRPKVVRPVRVGKTVIHADLKLNTLVYLVGIGILFAVGTTLLMLLESGNDIDITTAATASLSTLNNIGPGLARVGATQNYAWFTASSKIVMCVLMLVGRLEMFTVIVLFTPRFWRPQ